MSAVTPPPDAALVAVLDALPVGVALRDADGCLRHLNPAARRLLAVEGLPGAATGTGPATLLDHLEVVDERGRRLDPEDRATIGAPTATAEGTEPEVTAPLTIGVRVTDEVGRDEDVSDGEDGRGGEDRERARPGACGHRWLEVHTTAVTLPGGDAGLLVTYLDVSGAHDLELELEDAALHDPLTGLANLELLAVRYARAQAAIRNRRQRSGLVYLDLERFRAVNAVHGHRVGDRVLAEVGRRIAAATRAGDTGTRLTIDGFVVLCTELEGETDLRTAAERLAGRVDGPVEIDGLRVPVETSVGWTLVAGGEDLETALARAETAMYRSRAMRSTI